jgi:hypothetical protein
MFEQYTIVGNPNSKSYNISFVLSLFPKKFVVFFDVWKLTKELFGRTQTT